MTLTAEELQTLEHWERREKSSQVLVMRPKIVLACAEGWQLTWWTARWLPIGIVAWMSFCNAEGVKVRYFDVMCRRTA